MKFHQVLAVLLVTVFCGVAAKTELREAFTWKLVDFEYPNDQERQEAIDNDLFIQGNNVPLGFEFWKDKIFVTIPRWKTGVAASLAYFKSTDSPDSPILKPYPNWEAHDLSSTNPHRIVSPFKVWADSCDRLWILDTGTSDVLNGTHIAEPQVIIYDLNTDTILRNFTIPRDQAPKTPPPSFLANLAVEVVDCTDTYAYLADLGSQALVVYSWAKNRSWRITNKALNFDPKAINFKISGFEFSFNDGVFGVALTEEDPTTKYRTLYFHAFSSFDEYKVSTKFLRDEEETRNGKNADAFVLVGSRERSNTQASASLIDEETGVLFYTQVNLYGIGCWNYRHQPLNPETQELVAVNNKTLIYPNDIKMDKNGNLWVLSNNMIRFLHNPEGLDPNEVNFRCLTAPVKELISDTKCSADVTNEITNRFGDSSARKQLPSLLPLAYLVYWLSSRVL